MTLFAIFKPRSAGARPSSQAWRLWPGLHLATTLWPAEPNAGTRPEAPSWRWMACGCTTATAAKAAPLC